MQVYKIDQFFTCNHGAKNHRNRDEISVRKQAPEVISDCTTPPDHLIEEKRDCDAHQSSVLDNQALVPGCIGIQLRKSLGLSGCQSLT